MTSNSYALDVIIDPGHGGVDHGAVEAGAKESKLTLLLSKKLLQKLDADKRFNPSLTRSEDSTLPHKVRTHPTKHLGDRGVFISIHANTSPSPQAQGMEVYFQNQLPADEASMLQALRENASHSEAEQNEVDPFDPFDAHPLGFSGQVQVKEILRDLLRNYRVERSSRLATLIRENWRGQQRSKTNSIRQAPFFVVTHANTPSVLVEVGYLTNSQEAKLIQSHSYQETIADSLYTALVKYKEEMDKISVTP